MKEEWKPIKGYEGIYEISNMGRIKSFHRKDVYITYGSSDKWGYIRFSMHKIKGEKAKHVKIHRLVAEAFIPNPDNKPQINHINGDKSDNRVENLEWATQSENIYHRHNVLGYVSEKRKLNKKQVFEILESNEYHRIEADKFGIAFQTVSKIRQGVRYRNWYKEFHRSQNAIQ